ncbi:DUF4440 domain-containing protein [Pseudozobellia sp. WGM2]|uniref:YybH family protein n=1 Tax=Pseudozobellia sp. WGM2 TaxID=2787625 RepID=UPI001ADFA32D|nr:nuclear transport factor 2 family protein [Pseudozobellia sp. WGM2]
MKTTVLFFLSFLFTLNSILAQNDDEKAILDIIKKQKIAWTNGDLEGFMQGYWQSDSLTYYSGGKITRGWQTTLENYKKGYPNDDYIGSLEFTIDQITKINEGAYYVMGQYHLTRKVGDANGTFMIIFKKIDGQWKIIADSSC